VSDVTERPLVTFVLLAYNQERYIREAVEGALAQDYSPLEIILSDDCSSDSTFEIMRELAASYSGPHVVRLNRNNSNLGVGGHINVVMKMVSADFVVAGAGDDISEPTRVTKLTDVWRNSDGKVLSVHSSALIISEDGSLIGEQRKGSEDSLLNCLDAHAATFLSVLGATHAWDMRLIREFDPILDKVINEDVVLPARAALLGEVAFVNSPLVRYRLGVGISYQNLRNRNNGISDVPLSSRRNLYYCFLQKYRDFRSVGELEQRRGLFARSRATALFPVWLRSGKLTRFRLFYFLTRCDLRDLLLALVVYRLPKLVVFKHKLKFWIIDKLKLDVTP